MEENEKKQQAHIQIIWIIYGALIMSQFMYGFVGGFIIEGPKEPSTDLILPMALAGVALTTSIITFVVGKFIPGPYLTQCIIKWALTESIAVYGLVLVMLTGNTTFLFGFLLWSLALMAVHAPKKRDFEEALNNQS